MSNRLRIEKTDETIRRIAFAATLTILLTPPPLHAGEAQDRLFAVGVLDTVPTGTRLVFTRERSGGPEASGPSAIPEGEIIVTLAATGNEVRTARISTRAGDRERVMTDLPADAGHPLVLFFLESVVHEVSDLTGGSPFYIRNRIREALADQDSIEPDEAGDRLVFRPFTDDLNRDRLGSLADLEIGVVLDDSVPGGLKRFEAATEPGGFSDNIVFERLEGE